MRSMVERQVQSILVRHVRAIRTCPSTTLRVVPLPVPGRTYFFAFGPPRSLVRWAERSNTSPGLASSLSRPSRRATSW